MKNFDWTKFTKRIAVKATLEEIYNAWTKPVELEKWFLSKAVYFDSKMSLMNPDESFSNDYSYEWNWFLYEFVESGKVTEANSKDFLQFTFAGDCLVDVKLTSQNGFIIVELTQKNIPTDDESKERIRLGCESGWSFFLLNLKSVYEGGLDLRNKDENFKGMLNS